MKSHKLILTVPVHYHYYNRSIFFSVQNKINIRY